MTSLAQTQPDPPQNVRAVADVADALRITWDAPNAQPTTSYTLRWRKITDENSAYDSADTRDTRDTTYTILALTVGATYEVQVQAVNPDGMSEYAPDPAITAVPGLPGAPPVLVAEPGEKQLKLFWEMPASTGGAPITSYTLRWKPQDDVYTPEAAALTGAESETLAIGYIIPNLVSGRLYDVQVAAVNQFGAGAYVTTSAAPTLAAPQNLQVTADIGKVDMEWEAPLLENGARLTNYVVRWVKVPDDQGD
ncbi:MAG: fibronectin type III domain-containing protein, partial [Gammaproteobacteria bacterium]